MKALNALNSVIDSITSAAFKTLDDGRTVYFPHGVFGGGYVLPDVADVERVRQSLRRMWYAIFAVCAASGPVTSGVIDVLPPGQASAVCALALVAIALGTYLTMARAAKGYERTDAKLSVREAFQTQAKAMPRWFTNFQVAFNGLMVVGGIAATMLASTPRDFNWGVAATALFSLLLIASLYQVRARGS